MFRKIIEFSINRPKIVMFIVVALVAVSILQFPKIKVDTDPENMLPEKEFVRVFHHEIKKEFGLYDFIVVGVVNEKSEEGVFAPETLEKIYKITEKVKQIDGVIAYELISPSTKDDIEQCLSRDDEILVIVRRLDQERLFTLERIKRIENDVQQLKVSLNLA